MDSMDIAHLESLLTRWRRVQQFPSAATSNSDLTRYAERLNCADELEAVLNDISQEN